MEQTQAMPSISLDKICTVCGGNTQPFVKRNGKCALCRAEYYKKYAQANSSSIQVKNKRRYQKLSAEDKQQRNQQHRSNFVKTREEVFAAYGGHCICCGENQSAFLTIDHINGDGGKHRKEVKENIYYWLKRNNFPKDSIQLLCFNCNCAREFRSDGTCPHQNLVCALTKIDVKSF